jgi:hypothetical protein
VGLPVKTVTTAMRELGHSRIDLLKLDIEGAEYPVLRDIIRSQLDIQQLLVEFHHRFKNFSYAMTADMIRELNAVGFKLYFVSPSGEEFSFLRE